MKFETLCLHSDNNEKDEWGSIAHPICQSVTFVHKGVDVESDYSYSRLSNPTRRHVEKLVASLEGGYDSCAFSSGMTAITVSLLLLEPGDHVIASDDLYGGALRLFNNICKTNGIEFDFVNTSNVDDVNPYFQRPFELGADIVLHSGTKYLGGHNDTLAGFVVCKTKELYERILFNSKTIGGQLSPFDSFLIERGIKTLPLRMDKINDNAIKIANFLKSCNSIEKVYYVGLKDSLGYDITLKQSKGFGGMISIEVKSKELAHKILKDVKIFQYTESLGGVDSLITYPMLQTHADVPEEERNRRGINDRFLRISVGIENVDDLISDLKQAIND